MQKLTKIILICIFLVSVFMQSKLFAQGAQCTDANALASYKNTKIGLYEYAVFIFNCPTEFTYSVSSVSPPFTFDPSGELLIINGNKYKKITFSNVYWQCLSANNVQIIPGRKIMGLKMIQQFEGKISLVIGFRKNVKLKSTYFYYSGNYKYVVMKFK